MSKILLKPTKFKVGNYKQFDAVLGLKKVVSNQLIKGRTKSPFQFITYERRENFSTNVKYDMTQN